MKNLGLASSRIKRKEYLFQIRLQHFCSQQTFLKYIELFSNQQEFGNFCRNTSKNDEGVKVHWF